QLNFIAGPGQTLNVADNAAANRIDITISAAAGGPAAPSIYAVNGAVVGTRAELNLIAGTDVVLSGADNSAAGRVDVTVAVTAAAMQTPWMSDMEAGNFTLYNLKKLYFNSIACPLTYPTKS